MTKRFQKKEVEKLFDLPVWEWEYVEDSNKSKKKNKTKSSEKIKEIAEKYSEVLKNLANK